MHEPLTARDRLYAIAKRCLENSKGNTTAAIAEFVKLLLKERALLKELVAPLVLTAAAAMTREVIRHQRSRIIDQQPGGRRENVEALARGVAASLLDYPLSDGGALRDADRQKVMEAVEYHRANGASHMRKYRWLLAIAQSLPDGKTVGDVITDERARELWERANAE